MSAIVSSPELDMMVDCVDGADHVVGRVIRRQLVTTPVNFRVVHVLVLNSEGRLLLQRISRGLRSEGQWGSSCAGYVSSGESYDAAAQRKLNLELGLQVTPHFVGKTKMPDLGAEKFIGVFSFRIADAASVELRSKYASGLEFLSVNEVEEARRAGSRAFTETFLHVFDFVRSHGALP